MKAFSEVNARLISGCQNGIYTYQVAMERIDFDAITGIDRETYDILLAGPDHSEYLEAILELDNVTVIDNGIECYLFENDGDIWLYPKSEHDNIDWSEFN